MDYWARRHARQRERKRDKRLGLVEVESDHKYFARLLSLGFLRPPPPPPPSPPPVTTVVPQIAPEAGLKDAVDAALLWQVHDIESEVSLGGMTEESVEFGGHQTDDEENDEELMVVGKEGEDQDEKTGEGGNEKEMGTEWVIELGKAAEARRDELQAVEETLIVEDISGASLDDLALTGSGSARELELIANALSSSHHVDEASEPPESHTAVAKEPGECIPEKAASTSPQDKSKPDKLRQEGEVKDGAKPPITKAEQARRLKEERKAKKKELAEAKKVEVQRRKEAKAQARQEKLEEKRRKKEEKTAQARAKRERKERKEAIDWKESLAGANGIASTISSRGDADRDGGVARRDCDEQEHPLIGKESKYEGEDDHEMVGSSRGRIEDDIGEVSISSPTQQGSDCDSDTEHKEERDGNGSSSSSDDDNDEEDEGGGDESSNSSASSSESEEGS